MIVVQGVMTTNHTEPFALKILKYAIIYINIECAVENWKYFVYRDWDKVELDCRLHYDNNCTLRISLSVYYEKLSALPELFFMTSFHTNVEYNRMHLIFMLYNLQNSPEKHNTATYAITPPFNTAM